MGPIQALLSASIHTAEKPSSPRSQPRHVGSCTYFGQRLSLLDRNLPPSQDRTPDFLQDGSSPRSSTRHFRGWSKKTCDNCVIRPRQSETDQVSKLRSFLPPSCQLDSFQQLGFAPQGHQPPSRSSAGESSTSWGICQPQKGALTLLGQERMGCHFQT